MVPDRRGLLRRFLGCPGDGDGVEPGEETSAVAGILQMAVAVVVAVVRTLLSFDQVDQVLGVALDRWRAAARDGIVQLDGMHVEIGAKLAELEQRGAAATLCIR